MPPPLKVVFLCLARKMDTLAANKTHGHLECVQWHRLLDHNRLLGPDDLFSHQYTPSQLRAQGSVCECGSQKEMAPKLESFTVPKFLKVIKKYFGWRQGLDIQNMGTERKGE